MESVPSPTMIGGIVEAQFIFEQLQPPALKVGGNFTCVSSNDIGTVMRSVEIIVQRKWVWL